MFPPATAGTAAATDGAEFGYDDVNKLAYAHAVATEALRLHPSVPVDLKVALRGDTLPDGARVPKGATVVYAPYALGRDPRLWDDPLAFKPERFLRDAGSGGAFAEPSPWAYPVFNAGPRLCLGKPLAMMEIKLITNLLLRHFDFELATPHAGGYAPTLVLPMSPGLMVYLTPR